MLDGNINLNFKKVNEASVFANKMAKAANKYSKHRSKILNCKKCKNYVVSYIKKSALDIDNEIKRLENQFKKDMYSSVGIVDDPSKIINRLINQKRELSEYFLGLDKNKLCWFCRKNFKKMSKYFNQYQSYILTLDAIKKK